MGEIDDRGARLRPDRQLPSASSWLHLLELVEEAASDGRTAFHPLRELSQDERREIVTLPPTIAKLTRVEVLDLHGSNLVRIPPEIGAMTSLRRFDPSDSPRLHWFPYELTRCTRLTDLRADTAALYGPLPVLPPPTAGLADLDPGTHGTEYVRSCSVCDAPVVELHQRWTVQPVAGNPVPLLVNACSAGCAASVPDQGEQLR
ncbi:hypothetical protein BBK82_06885 [Lentzea guizhouensis]|uniref:Leucine-rich repeat domain-containing protein n=1 Tax=Lentzea guizhouensis TaxID=1586287 RepID=A0A1B2HDT0_9PSEU|nr:hypothetical protein [Lentzea guizhouensis]ANZ35852.1 hypothetical protein BBK82_06885 [Lentzea guizhouensis]